MARITSKDNLIHYIKQQLGEPIVDVDATIEQISQIIDDSVQKFTEYAYGTLEGTVLIELNGMGEYDLPDTITNVLKLSRGGRTNITNFGANFGSGFVPNIWSEQFFSGTLTGSIVPAIINISSNVAILEKYFGDELSYNFNPNKKVIQLLENFSGPVLLHYQYEYLADEANDYIYNHEWIKAYTKAKTKETWGNNIGKYDQTLVGGARMNYERLISEAENEIQKLEEELLDKWSDPCPISIA